VYLQMTEELAKSIIDLNSQYLPIIVVTINQKLISFSLDISPDTKNDVKFVQYCVPSVHNSVRRTRRPIKSLVKLQTRDQGCWCQSPHFMALSLYEECSAGRDTGPPPRPGDNCSRTASRPTSLN